MTRVLLSTWRTAMAAAWAQRGGFWLQVAVMIINDLVWLFFWSVLFSKTNGLNGWQLDQVLVLFSIATTTFGITQGLFPDALRLAKMAANGELDVALTMPVDPLSFLLVRKVAPLSLGDLIFGITLFFAAGHPTPERTLTWLVVVLLGGIAQTAFVVLASAAAMLLRSRGDHPRLAFDMLTIVGFYPVGIFGGISKVIVFTILPAAFITGIPARLLVDFHWSELGLLVGVTGTMVLAARALFQLALRTYRSGSQFTSQ